MRHGAELARLILTPNPPTNSNGDECAVSTSFTPTSTNAPADDDKSALGPHYAFVVGAQSGQASNAPNFFRRSFGLLKNWRNSTRRQRKRHSEYGEDGGRTTVISVALIISLIFGLLLAGFVFLRLRSSANNDFVVDEEIYERFRRRPELRFGAARAEDVELWLVDTVDLPAGLRRRRSAATANLRTVGEQNLASECGAACTLRLRHSLTVGGGLRDVAVAFRRWAGGPPPLVQILGADANRSTQARPFSAPASCIYAASVHVVGANVDKATTTSHSIVNLCGDNGGMFGMLAFADAGTFAIEPLLESENDDESRRASRKRRTTPSYAASEARLRTAHLVYRLTPQRYDATVAVDGSATLSRALNDLNFADPKNDLNHSSTSRSTTAERFLDDDLSLSNDFNILPVEALPHEQSDKDIPRRTPKIVILHENATVGGDDEFSFDRSHRSRRAANSWDNYIEVLVVADYRMLLYHQRNLENYVLTLFSTVASIYRHPSLGASISIVVVRLIILKHERAGPQVSPRAQQTLQQFCAWQQNYNDPNDDALSHHDVAILLTRHDICRATNRCDTLGLAELGTMCDAHKSCAIIEDNGLSAAFTIAHELGHTLNIPHDDERKCGEFMPLNKNNYHIMAPTLEYNTNPWSWSPCSADMLSKFLDTHRAQTHCILDQPAERRYFDRMFENSAPGAIYSVNQQCQFVFGAGAEICPYMPTCRRLWCSVSYGYQMGCRTQHMPWADGTPCGDNMWCHSGHCVGMSPRQRQKQDGAWGEWSTWRDCSRSCGGGVQKALRDCDSPPPANGGRYCVGQRERYRSCNVHDCPWDTVGFRESQCAAFDGRDVGIHGVPAEAKWLPKYTGVSENERCQLYCRQVGSAAFYLLRDKVLDGTPCDQSTDDICIDGVCHKAGCDHRLGSERRRDACGICGGNGTTCRTVHGTFNERAAFGYNEVLRLPAGAANIDIRQTAYNNANDDDNYLALRSSNGDFLLNGQYQVSVFRQQVYVLDTVLEYSGSDHATERLNGTGPLRADVFLHVLSVGQLNPPNIQYTFTVPIEPQPRQQHRQLEDQQQRQHEQSQQSHSSSHHKVHYRHRNHHHNPHLQQPPVNNFYWRHTDSWSNCTAKCQGIQTLRIVCVESAAHAPGLQRVVDNRMCTTANAPDPQQRACNVNCFNKWTTTARQVACVRVFTNGGEELAPAEECRVAGLLSPSPLPTPNDNNGNRYLGRWIYSEYSSCSASCGTSGIAQRNARCVDSAGGELDARHCDASLREPTRTDCNRWPCPRWAYGHWSECSRSCGGGVRVRHAVCQDAAGGALPAARCPSAEHIVREQCNTAPCTQWEFGDWSVCTATCGRGVQRREARCIELGSGSARVIVDSAHCDSRVRIVEKECTLAACARWQAGAWSTCSVTCADGFQTRTIACVGAGDTRLSEHACATAAAGERPASHRTCHNGACPQWRIREWTECSVTCGTGVRRRDVSCVFRDQLVDDSLCATPADRGGTPARQESCTLLACTRWDMQPWGECSVTCGFGGVQRRVVRCLRGASAVDDRDCDTTTQPRTERSCERDPCPLAEYSWEGDNWSECSVTCGGGSQQRAVHCVSRDGRRMVDAYCSRLAFERLVSSQLCNTQACAAQWRVGAWTPNCSSPTDCRRPTIVQRRRVFCEATDDGAARRRRRTLPDAHCDASTRPTESRDCEISLACSSDTKTAAIWDVGNWTTCSASCGGGWRRRSVDCVDGVSKDSRQASLCGAVNRPAEFEPCNIDACATVAWKTDEWSTCSVTCGTGVQRRRVWCQSEVLTAPMEIDVALCVRQTNASQPAQTRACHTAADCVAWRPRPWSACSESCGRGMRTRIVSCVAIDEDGKGEREVNATLCADLLRPADTHKCRDVQCARWQTSAWMPCSTSCGPGISRRDVFCQRGRHNRVADSECADTAKPYETRACQTAACPTYRWHVVSTWSKFQCIELCKPSDQHRRVQCMSDANRRAADAMCEADGELAPIARRACPLTACPYRWVAGAWSTCSKTCGSGIQFRKIECHVITSLPTSNKTSTVKKRSIREISSDNENVSTVAETTTIEPLFPLSSTSSMVVASRFCVSLERPAVSASCQLSACDAPFQWNVDPWSECSTTCGPGFRRRRVRCLSRATGERVDRKYCESEEAGGATAMPKRRESCFLRNCLPIDCADVKSQHSGPTNLGDGDYNVVVNGRRIPVYCYAMNETVPKTYITVVKETNYAEFYSKRLAYPYSCPYEGRRNDSCACNDDGHVNHGRTRFSRLRVDLRNMRINPNDFTFALSDYGNMVAYGSAGDCYSMTDCPQGQFSIDLRGTGLKIADDLQWVGQGYRVTTRVERVEGGIQVNGVCGGYCGECAPDQFKGLVLEPSAEKSS